MKAGDRIITIKDYTHKNWFGGTFFLPAGSTGRVVELIDQNGEKLIHIAPDKGRGYIIDRDCVEIKK